MQLIHISMDIHIVYYDMTCLQYVEYTCGTYSIYIIYVNMTNNYVSHKNDHYEILHEDDAQLSQKESFSGNGRFVDTIVPPRVRRVATDARSKIPVESQALG